MKFLRVSYFLYLSLLPALAMGALGQATSGGISWWWVLLFFGVIVFLDLVAEVIPYPETFSAALVTTFAVPVQVILALYNFENIWLIFGYQFLIEASGALLALAYYGLFKHGYGGDVIGLKKISELFTKKVLVAIPLVIVPALAVIKLFGPLFGELIWEWNTFFLVSALISSILTNSNRLRHGPIRSDEYMGYIILGIFAFIFGGPFLFHRFN